jgi:hypothetical protein
MNFYYNANGLTFTYLAESNGLFNQDFNILAPNFVTVWLTAQNNVP